MKKMAILFLLLGIVCLGLSIYFYTKKETPHLTTNEIIKQKGDDFEDYIIQFLGKRDDIKFVGKVSDYHKDGVSALENFEPDLKFKFHNTAFAVECKWRNSFNAGKITWAKDYQIRNYKAYQKTKNEKVYVAIGIGGEPGAPHQLFLVPLFRLTHSFATEDYIKEFEIKDKKQIPMVLKMGLR